MYNNIISIIALLITTSVFGEIKISLLDGTTQIVNLPDESMNKLKQLSQLASVSRAGTLNEIAKKNRV